MPITIVSAGQTRSGPTGFGETVSVTAGGSVSGALVNSGSYIFVDPLATASNDTVVGGYLIIQGGTSEGDVATAGYIEVSSGGLESNASVSGNYLIVSDGGLVSNASVSDGSLIVDNGGTATNATIVGVSDLLWSRLVERSSGRHSGQVHQRASMPAPQFRT